MCSNDLLIALPAEVYTVLDASSHLEITARAKLHKSILPSLTSLYALPPHSGAGLPPPNSTSLAA